MDINECRWETQQHIENVRKNIRFFTDRLTTRGVEHDKSKLEPPEVEFFAQYTENLKNLEYGSDEYKQSLEALKPALEHHYAVNRHHPEYHRMGINDMNLIDLIEMLCDWKASSERNKNGNLLKSIEMNAKRFGISNQLLQVLINTARLLEEKE